MCLPTHLSPLAGSSSPMPLGLPVHLVHHQAHGYTGLRVRKPTRMPTLNMNWPTTRNWTTISSPSMTDSATTKSTSRTKTPPRRISFRPGVQTMLDVVMMLQKTSGSLCLPSIKEEVHRDRLKLQRSSSRGLEHRGLLPNFFEPLQYTAIQSDFLQTSNLCNMYINRPA